MNTQIDTTHDGQVTYPDEPMKLETTQQAQIKPAPVQLIRKHPILTPTQPQITATTPVRLSESLDHYLFW